MAIDGRWLRDRRYRKASDFGKRLCPEEEVPADLQVALGIASFDAELRMRAFDALSPAERELSRENAIPETNLTFWDALDMSDARLRQLLGEEIAPLPIHREKE